MMSHFYQTPSFFRKMSKILVNVVATSGVLVGALSLIQHDYENG